LRPSTLHLRGEYHQHLGSRLVLSFSKKDIIMSNENSRTIDSYESRFGEYVAATVQTVQGPMKKWLDASVEGLPLDAQILELGSGFGRDAKYLQFKGYMLECSDATKNFIALLEAQGFNTRQLNAINDPIEGDYDAIIANAVLLHFTDSETQTVLKKVYEALNTSGRFAFTVIKGEGEEWTDSKMGLPRYFNYWSEQELRQLLELTGYHKVHVDTVGKPGGKEWLMLTAYK